MKLRNLTLALAVLISAVSLTTLKAGAETYQRTKIVICDRPDAIFSQLAEQFEEQPQWWGQGSVQATQMVLTVNPTSGEWTLVEYTADWACVLAVGNKSKLPASGNLI
jgi:hypothetical protein